MGDNRGSTHIQQSQIYLEIKDFVGNFLALIMLYNIYTILMTIRIIGTVLTLNLLRINSVSDLLISDSVGENRRNMSLLQNFKNNQTKYSKDELLEIRKTVKQDVTLKQINVESLKVIRK